MTGLPRIFIDMDDTLADYSGAHKLCKSEEMQYPQATHGFFERLKPLPGAVLSYQYLALKYDVWIATAPSVKNPMCYTEKRVWVEKHLGMKAVAKLIIIPDKSLLEGDILIDDSLFGRGQESFPGILVPFPKPAAVDSWHDVVIKVEELLA